MPALIYENTTIDYAEGTSVLEALESAGIEIPYSCRSGVCHSCMMKTDDQVAGLEQQGLTSNQVSQGSFLPCCSYPNQDVKVQRIDATDLVQGQVVKKVMLNQSVLALFVQVDFRWFPGQYLTVWKDQLEGRSYSIASRCDAEKTIELHIQRHEFGVVSRWLHDDLQVGDSLTLSTPIGHCFYNDNHHDKPIVMVCTGTGLAPLFGVLQEALAQGHTAPIYLYTAGGDPDRLYYQAELKALTQQHTNLTFIPVVRRNIQSSDIDQGMVQQDVVDLMKERHMDLKNHVVFLCGAPPMIKQVQRHCFFQGAAVSDILVDAFEVKKVE